MTRYTSTDGLMSSSDPAAVALWESITADMRSEQQAWTALLRGLGVKLAHPDDGWVHNRGQEHEYLSVSWYPAFNDDPQVGDLIALGAAHNLGDWKYRLARVTHIERGTGLIPWVHYHYADTGQRLPEPAPKRSWLRRRWTAAVNHYRAAQRPEEA
jgi:hypothetical protein